MTVAEQQRARRSDAGAIRQTPRDAQLLQWMSQMYGMPLDLIQRALDVSQVRVYQLVRRWERAGWIWRGRPDAGPAWVWPRRGVAQEYLGWDASWTPRPTTTAHTRAVAALRLYRMGLDLDRWVSERQLRHDYQGWRTRGQAEPHMPDGVEVLLDGTRALVEVELTPKTATRYLAAERQTYQELDGLLLQVENRAVDLGCSVVAYWCSPAARPVVDQQVREYQRRSQMKRRSGGSVTWVVRSLEEVPGWRLPSDGDK